MLILKLAWRNLWRNKRRSILTILAVFFATLLSVTTRSLQYGTYEHNIKTAIEMFPAYIQIQKLGFQSNPSLQKSFVADSNILSTLKNIKEIKAWSSRIYSAGLVSYKENSLGAMIFAFDPDLERNTSTLAAKIKSGDFISNSAQKDIVVGYKMLENLKANIGDTIVLLSNGFDGAMNSIKLRIAGTIRMGSEEFDAMALFMNLSIANELLAMDNRINVIAISLSSVKDIPPVLTALKSQLKDSSLAVLSWDEVLVELKQSIEFDNSGNVIFLILLFIIVAFGILNTVLMSITERFREFGIILAIGTKQSVLLRTVFLENLFLTLFGILIGSLVGWIINLIFANNPIYMSGEIGQIYEQFGFVPALYFDPSIAILFETAIVIFIISLITFIYPAFKLLRLEALKGIRYT
jgi:ABC-type lipoprotein release transport system permease subunit